MRTLAISPHADDVEIGMGGSLCKFVNDGDEVKILTVIIPCENIDGQSDLDFKEERRVEQEKTAKLIGADLEILDLDPYKFTSNREYIKMFDKIINDYSPDRIFTCWRHDSHQDHKSLSDIVDVATRKNQSSVYMYETMMPGGFGHKSFNPQYIVNVSNFIDRKREILKMYNSVFDDKEELVDSILARSNYRGGQIGVRHAEAFEVVKTIEL